MRRKKKKNHKDSCVFMITCVVGGEPSSELAVGYHYVSISRKVVGGQVRVPVATAFCGGHPNFSHRNFRLFAVFTRPSIASLEPPVHNTNPTSTIHTVFLIFAVETDA